MSQTAANLTAAELAAQTNLESILANMELRALQVEHADERGRIYNLAGDLCFDSGCRERALPYYGRAIDVFLAAGQVEGAVGVCRKIVRLTPEVVRARCTLAWMALGRGLIEEARQRIADYASAAASAGQEATAAKHLRQMADVSSNVEVLESLADALMHLGDDAGADRAFGAAMGRSEPGAQLPNEPAQRWATVLKLLNGEDLTPVQPAPPPVAAVAAPTAVPHNAGASVANTNGKNGKNRKRAKH